MDERRAGRTLISINNYYYPRAGAEVLFLEHNRLLAGRGWNVVPFCMHHEQNLPTPWSKFFVEEIELGARYPAHERVRRAMKAIYSPEARRNVRRLIDEVEPTLCHAHNVYHHISPAVLGAVRAAGVPMVMTLHDLKIACPSYSMVTHDGVCERCRGGRFYNVLAHRCMKGSVPLSAWAMAESYLHRFLGSYVRNVDRFVVPSRFFLEKFAEWGFDTSRFAYVPNFVNAAALRPDYAPGRRFLYFGRLSAEKGLRTLVRAAARAQVGLDLAGTGPLLAELEDLARDSGCDARFRGFLSGAELEDAIRGSRAVVLPSEWYENAPLSVLEAAALGKPAIVAAIGGLSELVTPGRTGWMFASGAVEELAETLRHVDTLPDAELEGYGARARQRVVARFSPERYLREMLELYRGLGSVAEAPVAVAN